MKKRIGVIFLVFLVFVLCAMAFTACHGGKYKMQDFIVDFEDFAKTYEVGDQVDLTKIKMYATFSDGTQEQIPLDKVSIKVDGVDIALNELTKITETVGTKIVEIKYSNVVRSVTIRVNEKHIAVLTSVTFNDANLRKQYNVNDTVSFAGLVVTAVYDGYENRNVELTDQNLAFFMGDENITGNLSRITETLGDKAIKVRYMTMTSTAAFTITVSDVLDSVVVDAPTTLKTNYKVNDAISFATVTATANYRSGRTEAAEVKYYLGDDEITNLSTLTATAGTKTVIAKATYQGVSGQKSIAINVENWIQSISLDTTGVQLEYVAEDAITIQNFADIVVRAVYADTTGNKNFYLTADGLEFVNANNEPITFSSLTNTAGTKVITVKYEGKSDTFSVVVLEKDSALQSLTVTSQPTVASYTAGSTNVSLDGLVITGVYKTELARDNDVIAYADFATNGVNLYYNDALVTDINNLAKISPIGANTVTVGVNYLGKTATFNLTVTNNVTSLEIVSNASKLSYLVDEEVTFAGLSAKAIKNFGEEVIAFDALSFFNGTADLTSDLGAFTATPGNKTVTVKFQGQEISFGIEVTDYIINISLSGTTSFVTDVNVTPDSKFTAFTGLQVYANYKSGASELLESGYSFSGNAITVPGVKTVKVTYNTFENSDITLTVREVLNSIEVVDSSIPTKIVKNGEVEKYLIGITVLGHYAYKGDEEIIILNDNGQSFLYSKVSFAIKVAGVYETINPLDMESIANESGNRELKLTYTYNDYTRSDEFILNVLVSGKGVDEFALPQSLVNYNATLAYGRANQDNVNSKQFESALFVNDEEDYLVGNDNPYRFVPTLSQVDIINETTNTLSSFEATSTIYLKNGVNFIELSYEQTGTYTKRWYHGSFDYVIEITNENKYQFLDDAENQSFKISVLPDANEFVYDPSDVNPVEWTVKVIKGYNLYDSKEICLLEQPSEATRAIRSSKYPQGRTYWDSIKTQLGLTGKRYSSIILHDELVVTKDDLPTDFWFELPNDYPVYYEYTFSEDKVYKDKDGNITASYTADQTVRFKPEEVPEDLGGPLDRAFLWDQEWGLLQYDMNNGEEFAIHGNFFSIDLSKLPLVCSFEPNIEHPENRNAYYMDWMSKISFLDVRGYDVRYTNGVNTYLGGQKRYLTDLGETPTESDENDEHFSFDNFMVRGNASPVQLLLHSDTQSATCEATNPLHQNPIGNPIYGGGIIFVKTHYCHSDITNINANSCFISFFSRDYTVSNYTKLKSYDSYLNAVYANGETDITITNCHFKRSGGPLMILTQGTDDLKNDGELNTSDYIEIPKIVVSSDSVLENFVAGEEVWFNLFAPGQVSLLKPLDGLLQAYFHKTFLQGNTFNLIAVSSQGQAYLSYKGDKMDRRSAGGPYKESYLDENKTTFDKVCEIIEDEHTGGFPVFTVSDTIAAVAQASSYYLKNASGTELSGETGTPTIIEFGYTPHSYITIHVGTGGSGLGIFTGLYDYAG